MSACELSKYHFLFWCVTSIQPRCAKVKRRCFYKYEKEVVLAQCKCFCNSIDRVSLEESVSLEINMLLNVSVKSVGHPLSDQDMYNKSIQMSAEG